MYRKKLVTFFISSAISGAAAVCFSVNAQAAEMTTEPVEQVEETSVQDSEEAAPEIVAEQQEAVTEQPAITERQEAMTEQEETAEQQDVSESQESASPNLISETATSSTTQTSQDGVAGSHLEGQDKILYDASRTQLEKVANAEDDDGDGRIAAIVSVPASSLLEETLGDKLVEDSGRSRYYVNSSDIGITQKITKENLSTVSDPAVKALFDFNPTAITNALLADCPYDLYWFDKEKNINRTTQPYYYVTPSSDGTQKICFDNARSTVSMRFAVSADYAAEPSGSESDTYTLDTSKARKAVAASENAKQIVKDMEDENLTDLEILQKYEEKICDLTGYDYTVTSAQPYGDPWQMIYVFDNDPTTNVTCEGYAKAMQYLSDETDFRDPSITCITVTGYLGYQSFVEPHMWNILHWTDGNNYLVDVTNSDSGTAGEGGKFFMVPVNYVAKEDLSPELAEYLPQDMPAFAAYFATADAGTDDEKILYYLYDSQALSTFTAEELSVYTVKLSVTEGEQTDISWNGSGLNDGNSYAIVIDGSTPVYVEGTSVLAELPAGDYTARIYETDILGRMYISLPVSFSVKERAVADPENTSRCTNENRSQWDACAPLRSVLIGTPGRSTDTISDKVSELPVKPAAKTAANTGDQQKTLLYSVMGAVAAAALALLRKKH